MTRARTGSMESDQTLIAIPSILRARFAADDPRAWDG